MKTKLTQKLSLNKKTLALLNVKGEAQAPKKVSDEFGCTWTCYDYACM